MRIEPLGELTPDEGVPEWLVSDAVEVPYFAGARLRFVFDGLEDDDKPEEVASAVRHFLALSVTDRDAAASYLFENYRKEKRHVEIAGPDHIWKHVRPDEVRVIRRSRGARGVYVQITAECAWEPEHGLQIVYRDGFALDRVGQQDGG